ncbi:hypothetical protein ANANG_G00282420, partial [Anguilla anguilla]
LGVCVPLFPCWGGCVPLFPCWGGCAPLLPCWGVVSQVEANCKHRMHIRPLLYVPQLNNQR